MATFDEVGIRYLTAASVQAFRDNSALWCLRYLFGKSDFKSAAFARSLALNNGMKHTLHFNDVGGGEDVALESYVRTAKEWSLDVDCDPVARNEHDNILSMFGVAVKALQQNFGTLFRPIATGLATHAFIGELNTPFLSVPSFIFEDVQLHIKYTNRCPSTVRPKELMAMAIDSAARQQAPAVLYVTAKKSLWAAPTAPELNAARFCLEEDAAALQRFLGVCKSPEHALSMCPLNPDFYQWKPQLLADARLVLLNSMEKLHAPTRTKGRRVPKSHPRHPHGDLLPAHRPGHAEDDL